MNYTVVILENGYESSKSHYKYTISYSLSVKEFSA